MKRIAIIGGGISGLSALHFLKQRYGTQCEIVLYEKESRVGGTIGTDRKDGFISDWGPNGFLDKVPLTLQLVKDIGADDFIEPANPKADKRFIFRNKRLHEIAPSPLKFLKSPLLSLSGRIRLCTEPFRKQKTSDDDESIYDFVSRRIGQEAADTMIVPMVSGIYGGDARELSLQACFPTMAEMEKQYGSLIKAMIAKKKEGKSKGGPSGPGGRLTSFISGLNKLVEVMEEKYKSNITTGMEVTTIEKNDNGFSINFKFNEPEHFDAVICATPSYAAVGLTERLDMKLSDVLASIPYASIAVICLGYNEEDISQDINGFGFLIPRTEGLRILGSIWTSSIFDGRSPKGMVQLRTMIGGATDSEAIELSEEQLVQLTHNELAEILGISRSPEYVNIFKWEKGIPQFTIGHPARVKRIDSFQEKYAGLLFTGNAYDGIGLNDCIVRSDKVVGQLAKLLNFQ
ncbi:MAG: protoporphyrinogen oxidase [candidate division Zixibacteria bacterium]|nr:protoporphyrinogen oxidase [candidate division Zixibacteria bacterium]